MLLMLKCRTGYDSYGKCKECLLTVCFRSHVARVPSKQPLVRHRLQYNNNDRKEHNDTKLSTDVTCASIISRWIVSRCLMVMPLTRIFMIMINGFERTQGSTNWEVDTVFAM